MECPGVYRQGSHTAIVVEVGRKNVQYTPMGEFTIKFEEISEFQKQYEFLDYHVGNAALRYLECGKLHGITDRAQVALEQIIKVHKPDRSITMADAKTTKKPAAEKAAEPKKKAAPAAKKEAPAKKEAAKKEAPAKKEAAKKEAPEAAVRGRKSAFEPTMKITLIAKENPKRAKAAERFALYKNGMTIQNYLDQGGLIADVRWDVKCGFISVK